MVSITAVRINTVHSNIRLEADRLRELVSGLALEGMTKSMRAIADRVHQLSGHCNITLVNDALRDWHQSLNEQTSAQPDAVSM